MIMKMRRKAMLMKTLLFDDGDDDDDDDIYDIRKLTRHKAWARELTD